MGKGASQFYTEFVLVKEFGTGVYDLPWETVNRLLQVMEIEGKVAKQRASQKEHNKSSHGLQTRPHNSGKRRGKQGRR